MSRSAYAVARGADTDTFSGAVDLRRRNTSRDRPVGGLAKRATDVALAAAALVLLAPILVLIAALLCVGLGRPVFVAQQRIGFAGRRFTAYLFRTAPNDGVRNLASEPALTTCLVSLLRDSGLDRLPQLVSILRGDMSFVGPRPISLDRSRHGRPDYFAARPGLIGMCRTDRFGRLGDRRRAAMDRYYVRRWTIWLDFAVLAGSLASVHRPEGAR
jgi:lipopolysaccharide/colanic/teichoic acid biosynthesis glycosyltransferase